MSTVPLVCPRCFKNLYSPEVVGPGLVRCDACGHAFPPGTTPLAPGSVPQYPTAGHAGPAPASFAKPPSPLASPPPQTPSGPSLLGCIGVALGIGALMLSCCGCFGAVLYFTAPKLNEPLFPPGMAQPQAQPSASLPGFPQTLPGAARTGRSLDEILTAIKGAQSDPFNSPQLMAELRDAPIDESRRGEVVQTVLAHLEKSQPLSAHGASEALAKWASRAEATQLAKFAAGSADQHLRRSVLEVIGQTGGDAATAKTLAPLIGDAMLYFPVRSALEKIGPDAEEALLSRLDEPNLHARRLTYDILGKVGGEKSRKPLQEVIDRGDPLDSRFARKALSEIERRQSQ